MLVFEEVNRKGDYARSGILHTRVGDVLTPTFMPDGTRGAVKSVSPELVYSTGVQIVLANTYHLHMMPGEDIVSKLGGLHEFTRFSGPILTDSGGFQVFSLKSLRKITEEGVEFKHPITGEIRLITPEKSIQIQLALGSDLTVAFDHLTGLSEKDRGTTKEAFDRTHRWLERCIVEFRRLTSGMSVTERPLLFGVVQGGLDHELRQKSLEIIQNSDVDGTAIGGLSVGETRNEMHDILDFLAPLYNPERPRFLLGVGDPVDVRKAIECGIDMMDCVMPTRNARHATVWSGPDSKRLHLTNAKYLDDDTVIDEVCDCYSCTKGFSKGFLRHQFKVGEPLAGTLASVHNLRHLVRICEEYRTN
ncbi:tRNA guanosine(34) transglycosylase Tgt [Candidatus Saccharibacteria bacterium]|nr:tRNA guanosine(34) transglycosylase Tgt [Candidatus Saccharibacteria bacterium]